MHRMIPLLVLLVALGACDKETKSIDPPPLNFTPEIRDVSTRPERVLASQEIQIMCGARDRDADPLGYWWEATDGEFTTGARLPIARWKSPAFLSTETLTVYVTDLIDTVSAQLAVRLNRVAPPGSLRFINERGVINLSWQHSPDRFVEGSNSEIMSGWSGYEVYVAPKSLLGLPDDSLWNYRFERGPLSFPQLRLTGLLPGQIRYVHVRARRDYEGVIEISEAGDQIDTAVPDGGSGSSPIYEARSNRGEHGLHLTDGSVVALDLGGTKQVDLYLGTDDPQDGAGSLRLKSPHLLTYRDAGWGDRVAGIRELGDDPKVSIAPVDGYLDRVSVSRGMVYAVRTPEGHYAKILISQIEGSPPNRWVVFWWWWQPLENYPRF